MIDPINSDWICNFVQLVSTSKDQGNGVVRVGVTRGGNRRALQICDLVKVKNFAMFSLLHSKIEFIPNISDDFLAFCTKTYFTQNFPLTFFPLTFFNHLPPNIFFTILPTRFIIFSSSCDPLRWCHPGRPAPTAPASLRQWISHIIKNCRLQKQISTSS